MPRYVYKCSACDETFMTMHSITATLEVCERCEAEGTLTRIPSSVFVTTTRINEETKQKAGDLVKQKIEEFKQDLKEEKRRLKETDYEQ